MAENGNESLELEDATAAASSVVNGPSPSVADVELLVQLCDVALDLIFQGHISLGELLVLLTLLRHSLRDSLRAAAAAEWNVGGGDHAVFEEFRRYILDNVCSLLDAGYNEHDISRVFPQLLLEATQWATGQVPLDDDDYDFESPAYANGGFGAVPASVAAVRSLEKQTFRCAGGSDGGGEAEGGCGVTECSVCFEEFVAGVQVSLMPCPSASRGHSFHTDCITKWLGISNMFPLCRHELPAA